MTANTNEKITSGEVKVLTPDEFWAAMGIDMDAFFNQLFPPMEAMMEEVKQNRQAFGQKQ